MAEILWNNSFNLDIEEIDKQNKEFLTQLNKLIYALEKGDKFDILGEVLESLDEYSLIHFQTEENLMHKFNYSELHSHKSQHEDFKNKIREFKKRFSLGESQIKLLVIIFLRNWFVDHIIRTDKRMSQFILKYKL